MSGAEDAPASRALVEEHRSILRVLSVLHRLTASAYDEGAWEQEAFESCVRFFRLFADACHHGKEEEVLFPALEREGIPREGGPIGVMLHEHQLGRRHVGAMARALEGTGGGDEGARPAFLQAATDYIGLLSRHITREDTILFPMGDRLLDADARRSVSEAYCDVDRRTFEGCTRQELGALAERIEEEWGGG